MNGFEMNEKMKFNESNSNEQEMKNLFCISTSCSTLTVQCTVCIYAQQREFKVLNFFKVLKMFKVHQISSRILFFKSNRNSEFHIQ